MLHCYPCLTYADPDAALEFLRAAFGFVPLAVYRDSDGRIAHAEVRRGRVALMIGPPREEKGWASPLDMPMRNASLYLALDGATSEQVDALCARAWESGAVVTRPPEDTAHGSREFSVRDPGGQEWHVGNYHPLRDVVDADDDDAASDVEAMSLHQLPS